MFKEGDIVFCNKHEELFRYHADRDEQTCKKFPERYRLATATEKKKLGKKEFFHFKEQSPV